MVAYVDHLSRALGKGIAAGGSDDPVLADLVQPRARLRADDTATTPADEVLARELSYDYALIALCRSLDVPAATSSRFGNPGQERARLERELSERGVVLDARFRA